ncbi:HAD family phosphatase [uncultured Pseudokineococcus sp.]|uniref:HAD family hydrolase n=1 Tax=uncultured Pseudokineococcus sp. TaxID=1642928 RepID=UPI002618B4A6|nr:HAD family phosphatase [uncultured Pseudokineococcus sp.]
MRADTPAPTATAPGEDGVPLPAAVLFDMDGTLVDTEPVWWAAERALVEAHGGTWTDSQAMALVGNQLEVSAEVLRREGGVDLPVREIIELLGAQVAAELRRDPRWRPGALEMLTGLAELGVPLALVTMSWRSMADAMLDHLPQGAFDAVVTGDACDRGKPHPEPYLRAAAALGVDPGRCVAVEDSPTGLASAEAAGVPVLVVPHVVEIPEGPRRTVVPTLAGVAPQDLLVLVRGQEHGTVTRS